MVLAYYAPASVMHRNIGSVTPILRDNYWLAVHVVTIMASYASAAIALILGNIALGYYLFGRYTLPPLAASQSAARRPPQACAVLAGFTYTAIQITVLLLTAGTILGALWADKSWGRFWGWDPKEAWALISLLVYLVILHARYVGWSGNFGMTVAAVFGFSAVLFTWYLVNFFWGSGMHSYSAGAGGQWTTISAMLLEQWKIIAPIVLDWLFLAAAAVRCIIETGGEEGWGMKHEG
jgi:ABC-type transport system involved in cytochrome c biogenesis permease subunit